VVRFELTVEIARPPEEVFAYLTDVSNLPEWQRSAVSAEAEGPVGEGSRVRERRTFLGRTVTTELEVTAYDPPRRFDVNALSGPVRLAISHTLEEQPEGRTRVEVMVETRAGGLMRVAAGGATRAAEREFRADFQRLKEILEASGRGT
jgi:uncharacterized protein YndB with AHSA1/START domain